VTSRTADTINQWRTMLDVSGGPALRETRLRANAVLGTDNHDVNRGASWAVKAHFCDRHHIASAFL